MQLAYERRKLRTTSGSSWFGPAKARRRATHSSRATRRGPLLIRPETASGWWCTKPRLRRMKFVAPGRFGAACGKKGTKMFLIRRTSSSRRTPLLTVDGLSSRQSELIATRNPRSTQCRRPGGRWTRITDGKHWDDKPRWSPDGRTIYFLSGPGGFFNVWESTSIRTRESQLGQPFQVSKFEAPD